MKFWIQVIIAIFLFFIFSPLIDALADLIISGDTIGGVMLAGFFKATYGIGLILAILRLSKT